MIDFSTDLVVGDLYLSDTILTKEWISSDIHSKYGQFLSAEQPGIYNKIKDIGLSVVYVDSSYNPAVLSIPDVIYILQNNRQLNAMNERIVSCGEPELSSDAAIKISVDTGFVNVAGLVNEFTREYIYKNLDGEQANYIKWGTFTFSDSLYGVGDLSCELCSLTIKPK